ncbi:hypothetical protein HCN44_002338 [Aphidius gifuensis]|uniref:Multidrug resistance-associated protein lethal(2)03659 n=1 Tax=Aphidius gifuensis TaxID=684658 RepID=A0A835CUQ6_APHGI|nr:probable multidrug resistance-associated protein lethal(2)03659 [Aphidius gifuensis]XP_044020605.1 probable multidrug resistance-associated protein lethal(2)03659 [Aphidius gifuensis]XP_044020606.1 probable multidrug resistance-associated protein lethal(2)03659 [Aphidius gifuensis]XP_044020607.1 probable multidrug resistance-associated protein lethal(2)03659 [Aphidius gifuensis]XP_044020608.1 probable multidrug resistance-associated protein lethal(2)03659 [Aphidius gifuensis]KAF7996692.1 hy
MDAKLNIQRRKNPRQGVNPLSALTFTWMLKTFWLGYKRDLEIDDLTRPLKEHKSSMLGEKISSAWEEELRRFDKINQKKKNSKSAPSLSRVLIKVFGPKILLYGIVAAIMELGFRVFQPLAVGRLLKYYSKTDNVNMTKEEAYLYAGAVILASALSVFMMHPYVMALNHIGMKMRVACCSLIYRKTLRLSKTALGDITIGQAINLLSNDVSRFDNVIIFLHYIWIGPVLTGMAMYFMYLEVGWPAVVGVGSLLLFIPLQAWLGKKSSTLRLKTAIRSDERVRLTNEIVGGIQAIKMYTWEHPFSRLIEKARKKEINVIRTTSYVRGILISFVTFTTRFSTFITILVMLLLKNNDDGNGNSIKAEKIFMLTAYFNLLRETMTEFFPLGIAQIAEASVSIKRLQDFMMYEEIGSQKSRHPHFSTTYHQETLTINNLNEKEEKKINHSNDNEGSVTIDRAHARWIAEDSEDTLSDLSMTVKPGQLIAVVGQVGSGKSSLLNVILKELAVYQGSVDVQGNIAYACQEPWLFAGSVRNNILFGRALDQKRYERVVKVCQLKRDYQLFPYGDKTIVGDRGVSLSGGQRARINLARAVYADAPIYLFDDPLSAVDAHVGKHMFEECIVKYLKGKTRILVTHQIQFLKDVDKIIVMKEGKIEAEGSYDDLTSRGIDFGALTDAPLPDGDTRSLAMSQNSSRHASISSHNSILTNGTKNDNDIEPEEVAEMRTKGRVGAHIFLSYFTAGGHWCLIFAIFILCVGAEAFATGGDYFIAYWVDLEEQFPNSTMTELDNSNRFLSREWCIYIFTCLTIGTITVTFIRSFAFFGVCMRASRRLHDKMFRSISRAPMRFFNTNSSGRILNRFSKDMGAIDELLPMTFIDCLQIGLGMIGVIVLVSIANQWLIIPTIFIGIIFYQLRVIYLSTSRSVKRLEGITRSPVFSHLNATMQGLTTIRSFGADKVLINEFDQHQDLHSSAWYIFIAASRTFGFWLDVFCLLYIILVTLSFLVLPESNDEGSKSGNVGLAITQSIGLTGLFQWGMRQSAELENQMTSVERINEFTNLESEPPLESLPDKKPKEEWPKSGKIEFKNVNMSYDPEEAPVLKNLNFTIAGKEKVGIVGRTGAGKSSLISALFRLAYIDGKIEIDGIDTGEIGLHDLRSKISIIPQEPFLFAGRLRKNLDPFDSYDDNILWSALEDVELKEMELHEYVSEGGSNLSVGQRQLVCLARAIIRNNRVLILDEATANVDPRTDELIQKTIRRKFADCTVLTIAHRLNTVMDSDKILVMDAGTVVEFDHPHVLLQNPDGALSSMINETGKAMANSLKAVALDHHHHHHRQRPSTTSL